MNGADVSAAIALFTVLYLVSFGLTVWWLFFAKKPASRRLHLANVPVHILHGVVSIHLYSDLRNYAGLVGYPLGSGGLVAGAGIRGIVGILLTSWHILAVCTRPQPLYLIAANLASVGLLIASAVLTAPPLPLSLSQCANLQPEAARIFTFVQFAGWKIVPEVDGCHQVLLLQIFTILIIVLLIFQTIYICCVPLPTPLRAVVFSALRLVSSLARSRETASDDVEKGLSKHNCHGARSECWACYNTICQGCERRHRALGLKAPRTDQHIENCIAICTSCYLGKLSSSEHDACVTAALHSGDLSRQHQAKACRHHEKQGETSSGRVLAMLSSSDTIALCHSCAGLGNPEITAARERKETAAYQLAVKRPIHCAYCAAMLPKDKQRWWICEVGKHECHWEGHEVRKGVN